MFDVIIDIDHIENYGKDFQYYRVWFSDGKHIDLTETEFIERDKYYNGELALKVIN